MSQDKGMALQTCASVAVYKPPDGNMVASLAALKALRELSVDMKLFAGKVQHTTLTPPTHGACDVELEPKT